MANRDRRGVGVPPRRVQVGKATRKTNWLAWLLLALGVLALLVTLSRCERNEHIAAAPRVVAPGTTPILQSAPVPVGISSLGAFLASREALPQTFVFERLNFDTASSDVRPADREELSSIATALTQYPGARIRVIGYADARGPGDANAALGTARADSVKAALVASGVPAVRIESVSGGEAGSLDGNATSAGQAENRRTELVILQR